MKSKIDKLVKPSASLCQEIVKSMVASFKIEGIHISEEDAAASFKRLEAGLKDNAR
jgi:hypothetical protein